MHHVKLTIDYTSAPPDTEYLAAINAQQVIEARLVEVAGVPAGMTSGRTSVGLIVRLPDGRFVWSEISLQMLRTLTAGLTARYGEEG